MPFLCSPPPVRIKLSSIPCRLGIAVQSIPRLAIESTLSTAGHLGPVTSCGPRWLTQQPQELTWHSEHSEHEVSDLD